MAVEVLQPESERARWLAWRKTGIGGSDAAAVAGLSPWRTPLGVWLEKSGYIADLEESEPMYFGSLFEGLLADEFEKRTGLDVIARQQQVTHPERPWMLATLDGLVAERGAILGAYEGKTTGAWAGAWREGLPDHYLVQCQHTLAVTGLDRAWVTLLVGGQKYEIYTVERDPAAIEIIIELEGTFWRDCVLAGVAPAASIADAAVLREAHAKSDADLSKELPEDALDLVVQREAAKAVIKQAESEVEAAEARLMELLGPAEVGTVDGQPVISWKRFEREQVDLKALRIRHPELVAQFTTKNPYRRFGIPNRQEEK